MIWIAIVLLAVLWIMAGMRFFHNRTRKKQQQQLVDNWGKPKDQPYLNFKLISSYFNFKIQHTHNYLQVLTDRLCHDLHFESLFRFTDHTVSRIGQQYLYYKLRSITPDVEKLQHHDKLAEQFAIDEELRLQAQTALLPLSQHKTYYFQALLNRPLVEPPAWYFAVPVLSIATFVLVLALPFYPVLLLALLPLFISNMVVHYWNKQNIGIYATALLEYGKVHKAARELADLGYLKKHFIHTHFFKQLQPLQHRMRLIKLNNAAESDVTLLLYSMFELLKILFNIEVLIFFSLIKKVQEKSGALQEMFEFIGQIDCALSVASLRAGLPAHCKPEFTDPGRLKVEDVVHPLVDNCVPNSLHLQDKSLLLTGSNMSGKTTFIRALATNMLLAQTLYLCTARHYSAPFSLIYSSIGMSDDMLSGKSYYLEEVTTLKAFVEKAAQPQPCLFVLDEIFKGTNTLERIAAGKAILSYLARPPHLVLVSTHDTELTRLLQQQYELYHFAESVEQNELHFDHKLKQGPLTTRNAIRILEISNYPSAITAEARATVARLEQELQPFPADESYPNT